MFLNNYFIISCFILFLTIWTECNYTEIWQYLLVTIGTYDYVCIVFYNIKFITLSSNSIIEFVIKIIEQHYLNVIISALIIINKVLSFFIIKITKKILGSLINNKLIL